jgi:hypothetical protein
MASGISAITAETFCTHLAAMGGSDPASRREAELYLRRIQADRPAFALFSCFEIMSHSASAPHEARLAMVSVDAVGKTGCNWERWRYLA